MKDDLFSLRGFLLLAVIYCVFHLTHDYMEAGHKEKCAESCGDNAGCWAQCTRWD